MNIRLITKDDLPYLSRIYVKAYTNADIGEKWDEVSARKMLTHLYKLQPDLTFTAEINNMLVGAVTAIIKPWWNGNLLTDGELFVDPDYQGQGIGKKLIKHLFQKAKEKYNAKSWDTFTHIIHKHPLEWYKSLGFSEISEWTMIRGEIQQVLNNLQKVI